MLVREVVIPVSADQLWDALTEPEAVAAWFGSQVEWDLRPGGPARFLEDDGTRRGGVIVEVLPGRHLSFRWWPEEEGPDAMSEVNYDLEPDEDGTRLTVTEEPLPRVAPSTEATARAIGYRAAATASWSDWDTRLFQCWALSVAFDASGGQGAAGAVAPLTAVAAVGRAIR